MDFQVYREYFNNIQGKQPQISICQFIDQFSHQTDEKTRKKIR